MSNERNLINKFKMDVLNYYSCNGNFQQMGKEKLKEEYSSADNQLSENDSFEELKQLAYENNIVLKISKKTFNYGGWEYDDRRGDPIPGTYTTPRSETKNVAKLTYNVLPIEQAKGFDERISKFYYCNNSLYETINEGAKSKESLQQIRQTLIECTQDTYIPEQIKLIEKYLLYESEKFFKEKFSVLQGEVINDIISSNPSINISMFKVFPYYEYSSKNRMKSIEKFVSDIIFRKFAGLNIYPEVNIWNDIPNQDDIFFINSSRDGYIGYGLIRLSTLINLALDNEINIMTPDDIAEAINDYKTNRGISFSNEKCEPTILTMSTHLSALNKAELNMKKKNYID